MSPFRWFWIALACFVPLHVSAVVLDEWFILPPKPIGDGPDYEAIGYGLSQGHGWSTSLSAAEWRSVYENANDPKVGLDYSAHLARRGPITPETNRPPLWPLCIAAVYKIAPRGPIAFGIIRIMLACCLSLGCAISVAWGVSLAKQMNIPMQLNNPMRKRGISFRSLAHASGYDKQSHASGYDKQSAFQSPNTNGSLFPAIVGISLIAIVLSERNLRNYSTDFLTEPLALVLTQSFVVVAWYGAQRGSWQWAVLTGALFAGMYFCRGVFVLWVPFVIPWLWYAYRITLPHGDTCRLAPIRWVLMCMMVFGLITSVWWVRNCYVLGSLHPLGTKGSTTLLGGYCDESFRSGGEWQIAPERDLRRRLESKLDWDSASAADFRDLELELGKQAAVQAKKWIVENLDLLPSLFAKRAITEWNPYRGKALLLKLFALVGVIWLACYNRVALVWLIGPLVINTFVVALTYSVGGRFLVPTYGLLYILAAFGFSGLLAMLFSWRDTK